MGIRAGRLIESCQDRVYSERQSGRGIAVTEEDAGCRVVQVRGFQAKLDGWKSGLGVRPRGLELR